MYVDIPQRNILKWRLENNEKLQVKFEEPRIPYRETITKAARADYRHKKQSGGAGQFGEVHLIVEPYYEGMPMPETYKFNGQEFKMNVKGVEEVPLEWGGKLVFVNSIVGGSIDARFMPAILKGIIVQPGIHKNDNTMIYASQALSPPSAKARKKLHAYLPVPPPLQGPI